MKLRCFAVALALSTSACELAFPIVLDADIEAGVDEDAATEEHGDAGDAVDARTDRDESKDAKKSD